MTDGTLSVDSLFTGKDPVVRQIYDRIVHELEGIGPFAEEPRKTSIHLVHTVAFAGIHPRKSALILSLRTDRPVDNPRVVRSEQVSANRWHIEFKLTDPSDVDEEVRTCLAEAVALV
jgi:Domain of unknown function (DUF5655)